MSEKIYEFQPNSHATDGTALPTSLFDFDPWRVELQSFFAEVSAELDSIQSQLLAPTHASLHIEPSYVAPAHRAAPTSDPAPDSSLMTNSSDECDFVLNMELGEQPVSKPREFMKTSNTTKSSNDRLASLRARLSRLRDKATDAPLSEHATDDERLQVDPTDAQSDTGLTRSKIRND